MTGHVYGPHRPEDAPVTITVLGPEKWPKPVEVPISRALLAQRQWINHRAHKKQQEGTTP